MFLDSVYALCKSSPFITHLSGFVCPMHFLPSTGRKLITALGAMTGNEQRAQFHPPGEGKGEVGEVGGYDTWIVLGVSSPICATAVNAFVDPFLYAYRTPQFRSIFKQQWGRIKPKTATKKGRRPRKTPSREHTSEPVVIVNFRRISA